MSPKELVVNWFEIWQQGNFYDLPLSDNFKHISPYGIIEGKEVYLKLVNDNREKFLGHTFKIHEIIEHEDIACVRYTSSKEGFSLDVSEWHFVDKDLIREVIAYYNIPNNSTDDLKYPTK